MVEMIHSTECLVLVEQMACKKVETIVENIYVDHQRRYFESVSAQFYSDVLPKVFKLKSPQLVESTKRYMEQILEYERKKNKKEPFSLKDYKKEACMCAYMHQYSVYYTSTVMGLFTSMLNEKTDIKKDLFSKKEIKVCCLGGGSGTEAVGIGFAIDHVLKNVEAEVELSVSIVDVCISWKRVIQNVVKAANRMSGKVNWKIEFIERNICDPLCSEAATRIRKADCITMVNFSSSVFSTRTVKKHVIRGRFEEILKLTKSEAMIFYLSSSDDHYSNEMENITKKFPNLLKIYRQQECFGRQTLSEKATSAEKSFLDESLKAYYLKDYSSITASVWIKRDLPKAATGKVESTGTRPKVFLEVNKRQPASVKPRLPRKGSTLSNFLSKKSEQLKKEHKYKNAARNSPKRKATLDDYD